MNKSGFDAYRQNIWNQGAGIVDEHDGQLDAGTLSLTALNGLIARLEALMVAFLAEYQNSRAPKGPIEASWIDSRFRDYYDFFGNILAGWRQEAERTVQPGGSGGGSGTSPGGGGVSPGGSGGSGSGGYTVLNRPVYRMILFIPDRGVYGTSGTYWSAEGIPLCTPDTPGGCNGREFPSIQAAIDWARSNNETPVYIDLDWDPGVEEAWRLAAGGTPRPPASYEVEGVDVNGIPIVRRSGFTLAGMSPVMLGGMALLAVMALGGKKNS